MGSFQLLVKRQDTNILNIYTWALLYSFSQHEALKERNSKQNKSKSGEKENKKNLVYINIIHYTFSHLSTFPNHFHQIRTVFYTLPLKCTLLSFLVSHQFYLMMLTPPISALFLQIFFSATWPSFTFLILQQFIYFLSCNLFHFLANNMAFSAYKNTHAFTSPINKFL